MNKENVFISGGLRKIEETARSLIANTLTPLESEVSIVAVKVDYDGSTLEDAFKYHCIILAKHKNGSILRTEARDCDEMLAVYKALSSTIDSFPLEQNGN